MIEEKMMRFAQIRSSYARKKFGNLSDEDKALNEYDRFCLELIKEIDQLKDVIEEVREYINTNTKEEYENIEVDEHFGSLLQILDKVKIGDKQ